jgi:MinD-like ATPase involved in chromosome partitioning or flagellar assembly
MSWIGEFEFLQMKGLQIPLLASAVEIIDRSGTDGVASRVDALKAEEITEYTIAGVYYLADAQSMADLYAALKGTYQTVIDDLEREVTDVLIIDVRVTNVQRVLNSSPTGTNYLIYAVWLLKPTKAS